jgi:hypothetical protein
MDYDLPARLMNGFIFYSFSSSLGEGFLSKKLGDSNRDESRGCTVFFLSDPVFTASTFNMVLYLLF